MQKYKIVFDMLEDKKKQAEIVKETGFTIDVVKKVSQLKKIYSKIAQTKVSFSFAYLFFFVKEK